MHPANTNMLRESHVFRYLQLKACSFYLNNLGVDASNWTFFFFFFPKWKEVFKILVTYFYDMILLWWYLPLWFFPTALLVFPSFMCSSFFPHLFITCWCYSALLGFILFVLCICARNFFYSHDFSCHIHLSWWLQLLSSVPTQPTMFASAFGYLGSIFNSACSKAN